MTHAIQCELICDICEARFVGRTENLPNTAGITKGKPLLATREEAKQVGWKRIKHARGLSRGMTLDCCCKCAKLLSSSLIQIRESPRWFERKTTSIHPTISGETS